MRETIQRANSSATEGPRAYSSGDVEPRLTTNIIIIVIVVVVVRRTDRCGGGSRDSVLSIVPTSVRVTIEGLRAGN